ncbi:MAG: glycosyltransferase family 2 protein [Phycisphaerales bacterium]|nr:glycosyltransferase family 2 protein [Phycisphaerales bacterium]
MTAPNPGSRPAALSSPSASAGGGGGEAAGEVEVSFVMPCLNEAETIEACVRAAVGCIARHGLAGEVVVGDNGSTDGSQDLARRAGARVVDVPVRGYGAALRGAIAAARGRFIVMGDSDGQHDFGEGFRFVEKLREGHEIVMGSRSLGVIAPGAMGFKNRYIGNPAISLIGRVLFGARSGDFNCGFRGFTRAGFERLGIRTTGMEFASEHIIKSAVRGLRFAEVPITVHPSGRSRPAHLRPWRDGWRHLRFMLCLSPRWTLLVPGLALMGLGALAMLLVAFGAFTIGGVTLDVHTLVVGSLLVLVGYQFVTTAAALRIFALEEELGPPAEGLRRLFNVFTLERGVVAGLVASAAGLLLIAAPIVHQWWSRGFGTLDPAVTLRPTIIGATLTALGVQTVLMSFVYSMMGVRRSGTAVLPGADR